MSATEPRHRTSAAFTSPASCAVCKAIVYNPDGVHIQPAAELVALARRFQSEVHLVAHGKRAEVRDIIDVLSADLRQGTEVLIRAEGADAEEAVAAVGRVLASVPAPVLPPGLRRVA